MSLAYADAHGALVESLDARVREIVRRDGVDPQSESALVRRIAEDADARGRGDHRHDAPGGAGRRRHVGVDAPSLRRVHPRPDTGRLARRRVDVAVDAHGARAPDRRGDADPEAGGRCRPPDAGRRLVEHLDVRGSAVVDETDQRRSIAALHRDVAAVIERLLDELRDPVAHIRPVAIVLSVVTSPLSEPNVAFTAVGSKPQWTMQSWQRGFPLAWP